MVVTGKKVKGRKRHLLVDTMGMVLVVLVHAANIQDRDGARLLLAQAKGMFPRLKLIWADGGYAGKLIGWVLTMCGWLLEIVKRSDKVKGSSCCRVAGWWNGRSDGSAVVGA